LGISARTAELFAKSGCEAGLGLLTLGFKFAAVVVGKEIAGLPVGTTEVVDEAGLAAVTAGGETTAACEADAPGTEEAGNGKWTTATSESAAEILLCCDAAGDCAVRDCAAFAGGSATTFCGFTGAASEVTFAEAGDAALDDVNNDSDCVVAAICVCV
jgi:hypothetical protein